MFKKKPDISKMNFTKKCSYLKAGYQKEHIAKYKFIRPMPLYYKTLYRFILDIERLFGFLLSKILLTPFIYLFKKIVSK